MTTTTTHDETPEVFGSAVFTGTGVAAKRLRLQVARIAPHFRIALLTGEDGTGKRVIAREMHRRSPLAQSMFVAMSLTEFVEAGELPLTQGTIYLYGLESSSAALQELLLQRLRAVPRQVHLIFGCECELKGLVATGRLRAELFNAVATIELRVTPLRERLEDLEELATSLLRRDGREAWFAPSAIERMSCHGWPSNLRELGRMCAALGDADGAIEAYQLPALENAPVRTAVRLDEVMQNHVKDVLQRCAGNKLRAAELLGISRSTLYRMLETTVA